jgi:hypothetical protein
MHGLDQKKDGVGLTRGPGLDCGRLLRAFDYGTLQPVAGESHCW